MTTAYIVTTAPEAYDYATATTMDEHFTSKVRLVEVTTERPGEVDYLTAYQADRYRSGLYGADVYTVLSQAQARFDELVDLLIR